MSLQELLSVHKDQIMRLADQYHVENIRIFGSVARRETHSNSDIDLLVELRQPWSLLDHVGFKQALEDILGCSVDVVVQDGLRKAIREHVLNEAIPL
jgi:hypothetical protein